MTDKISLDQHEVDALAHLVRGARRIVVFTGAGISTESGIPDYRGPGGVWERNAPPTLSDYLTNETTRRAYWRERRERYPILTTAQPNLGHFAVTKMQDAGVLGAVITQNIDGLHQKSGVPADKVIELHGSAHRVRCLHCNAHFPAQPIQDRLDLEEVPTCMYCSGPLRAATILFGESLPPEALAEAIAAARSCDLMIVVGSSLIVQPAARMPEIAVSSGARLAIVNLEPTPLDHLASVVVRGPAGAVLSALVAASYAP